MKFVLFFSLSFFSLMTHAGPWGLNNDHSEILFQVPYMGVSELSGRFNEFSGAVEFKDDGITVSGVEVKINSSSIDTNNKMRDGHLRGSDFFQSKEHPYIIFKSKKVTPLSKNSYKAEGSLTIKGISRVRTIEFSVTESLKDTWGYENKFVKFKSSLNRKDFKINWNKTLDGKQFLVGDNVSFWGTFQIQPNNALTPKSKHMIPDTEYIRERDLKRRDEEESFISRKLRSLINGE